MPGTEENVNKYQGRKLCLAVPGEFASIRNQRAWVSTAVGEQETRPWAPMKQEIETEFPIKDS